MDAKEDHKKQDEDTDKYIAKEDSLGHLITQKTIRAKLVA